ncbi:sodium-dependent transporter [Chitinimonas sp. BJB300]|uniref:sodium-dependent transporter n=1 Tax=Chitinimonas sp. BJB300 TaxID=1559339 RepID=UPI000C10C7AD|nr:sodium-dependent transporter [Chitinimonas sp. BJB300]PHV09965.1 sodium-dependent transporter [Chitinimonas sp. BJB300]TSJ90780.1 sodium-dependent transporter [Chitinimonas sp. BJB300]
MSSRANWGSKLGFILAASGSAVGLGAIWKFPYVAGKNGGGVFLLVYLACVFTIGIAMLLAEMVIGHSAKKSATTAYRDLKGGLWPWAGRLSVLCVFVVLAFYSVVGGWTFAYLWGSITGEVLTTDTAALRKLFKSFTASPQQALIYTALFSTVTAAIVLGGIEKGIERASKILMPALFILMLVLITRSLTLPGAINGVLYFITPDFTKFSSEMVIEAMGLALFSLSVGGGMIIAYGSYIAPETKLVGATLWITVLATLASLLAGLMVLPAVFAFHVDPAIGPSLTFITMPALFAQMPAGQFFAISFFLLLIFAALTSSVSILEPIVSFLMDEFGMQRKPATITTAIAAYGLSIPAALSFGPLAGVTAFDKIPFDLMDYLASNIMMPAGGLLAALFVGWAIWPRIQQELSAQGANLILPIFRMLCAVIAPIVICVVWIHNL